MTVPQIIYLVAVSIYILFFFLFLRFFFWKAYADLNFWRRKPYLDTKNLEDLASKKSRRLPFMSIFVPARNEADVIEKTIDHMLAMNYPADRYEVLIATDQKEEQARQEKLPTFIAQATEFLTGNLKRANMAPQARSLALGLLSHAAIVSGFCPEMPGGDERARNIAREMAENLILSGDRVRQDKLSLLVKRHFPNEQSPVARDLLARYLHLAAIVTFAFYRASRESVSAERQIAWVRVWRRLKDPGNPKSPAVVQHQVEMASGKVLSLCVPGGAPEDVLRLREALAAISSECLPTTQDIVQRRLQANAGNRAVPRLKHVDVPFDFDGKLGGVRTGWPVTSTKGRALNYALSEIDPESEMSGFYDAESRPDPDVLLYIAYRRLGDGERASLFQGPVFQVRNFYQMGPFCKIASLYQAIAHDWYMPALFKRLPFVGGTNLWIATDLVKGIGGYDYAALTEDLELGARAYLLRGAWPEYLPYYSSEQTPPTFNAFFRQRLRWGTGHLQVMDKIRAEKGYPSDRKRPLLKQLFIKGQVEWVVYQSATFVPPVVLALWWRGMVDPYILPDSVRWVLNGFSATYIAFTIYAYYRYMPYLDTWSRPDTNLGRAMVVLQLFFLPMAAFFFPVPYSSAMVLKALNRHPKTWTKTPRTKE